MPGRYSASGIPACIRLCLVGACAGLLAGCVDMATPEPDGATSAIHPANMARREGVSPAGASVAMVGFGGAPQALTDQYRALFSREAQTRGIIIADMGKANYLVRSYLSASVHEAETDIAFVLDVFDAKRQRAQRIEDQVTVKTAAADPWSSVDQSVLAAVASRSADDLANFLTNTPEAIAANDKRPASRQQSAESGETTIAASAPARDQPNPPPSPRSTGFAALH
jgi:hypothetical protein